MTKQKCSSHKVILIAQRLLCTACFCELPLIKEGNLSELSRGLCFVRGNSRFPGGWRVRACVCVTPNG